MSSRILIMEDEALIAADLEDRLLSMGYDVCAVCDETAEAWKLLNELKPDLALLDIRVRGAQDGIELGGRVRRELDIPFIFLTAHADEATLAKARETEPAGYVLKPFHDRELRAAIEIALSRHHSLVKTRTMERWLSTTLSSIADGVLATDLRGRINFINDAAERITGWPAAEALGQPLDSVFRLEGQTLRRRSGTEVPLEYSLAPIQDQGGVAQVLVFRDCTQKLQAQAEKDRLLQQVQDAQRLESLGVLAAGVSHDFNNLLGIIRGNVSLLEGQLSGGMQQSLHEIDLATQRASLLCSQMLAFAGQAQQAAELDLADLLKSSRVLLEASLTPEHRLQIKVDPVLPSIQGESSQVQQVLVALVRNAVEAMTEGGTVGIYARSHQLTAEEAAGLVQGHGIAPGLYVELEVCDQGEGIAEENLPKLFEPFYTSRFHGRGLGLWAVAGALRRHAGGLRIESRVGQGSRFFVYFPVSVRPTIQAPPPSTASENRVRRALVVDDEPSMCFLVERMLRRCEFEVICVEDGLQGLEHVQQHGAGLDLVVMDLVMPRMGGREAIVAIRRLYPDLPIVIISGNEPGHQEQQTPRAVFLRKPFSLAEMRVALGQLQVQAG
ncbi:MAG: response regulator [Candidatus Eremiobacteraeota bacterium]|nr:response regulator [Candidatus Eremiobacteraeota bacterium]